MTSIVNNISLNIYEPESSFKINNNRKQKSIITQIIKNPEIPPAKKRIKIKYKEINQNSNNLYEYNIFRRPGEKLFRDIQKIEKKDLRKDRNINGNNKNKNDKKNQSKKFLINRKTLEKINKNIPNNLYDYLHPYEYQYYSKRNNILKNYLKMKIQKSKELSKTNEIKILKFDEDDNESNKIFKIKRYKSNNIFLPLNNYLKRQSNEKGLQFSRGKQSSKTMNGNINKSKNIIKINSIKTKIKNEAKRIKSSKELYENYNDEYSSSLSFTEKINDSKLNTVTNLKKKLYVNGDEVSDFNKLLYYETLPTKKFNSNNNLLKQRPKKMVKYNQQIFNRNNNIFVPYEEMKKVVFNSYSEKNEQKLKKEKVQNFFRFTEIGPCNILNKNLSKDKKTKLENEIAHLNKALTEIKFYMINNKIDREKFREKLEEMEKKMNYREDRVMIIKDILFQKLNNSDNQNDYISYAVNKNQYVNKLISSYVNFNEKKSEGLLDKKFMGGLKKLNEFGLQDAAIRNVIGENNYFIKHSINKIEEVEICKDRKHLGENMKKIMHMIKMLNNRKKHLGEKNDN